MIFDQDCEPVFISRKGGEEGDGWVMTLVNNYAKMSSELHILDTKGERKEPQAVIDLPIKLGARLHGNWVDAQVLNLSK